MQRRLNQIRATRKADELYERVWERGFSDGYEIAKRLFTRSEEYENIQFLMNSIKYQQLEIEYE